MAQQKDHSNISYILHLVSVILGIVLILNITDLITLEHKYSNIIIGIIMTGLIKISNELETIPITEAIANYWKYKIKKQDKNTAQDYASFKKEENTNDK